MTDVPEMERKNRQHLKRRRVLPGRYANSQQKKFRTVAKGHYINSRGTKRRFGIYLSKVEVAGGGVEVRSSGGVLEDSPGKINDGLFTKRFFKQYEIITEFCGAYLTSDELKRVRESLEESTGAYCLESNDGKWAIDFANFRKTHTADELNQRGFPVGMMANREDQKNKANAFIHQVVDVDMEKKYGVAFDSFFFPGAPKEVMSKNRFFLVANENIVSGEEIFTDYNFSI